MYAACRGGNKDSIRSDSLSPRHHLPENGLKGFQHRYYSSRFWLGEDEISGNPVEICTQYAEGEIQTQLGQIPCPPPPSTRIQIQKALSA